MTEETRDRDEIAKRIREMRRSRNLSLHELAGSAGISSGHLSEVERGRSAVSGEKLARLATQLGVSVDYLLSGRSSTPQTTAVSIPAGLSEAAAVLNLSFEQTLRLLRGKESLVARRSSKPEGDEWVKEDWIAFHKKVKDFL